MPIISTFFGIIIRMYFKDSEHNPPHIHAIYNEHHAAISIKDCKVLEGYLSPKALSLVIEWIRLNKKELLKIWESQKFKKIEPLK